MRLAVNGHFAETRRLSVHTNTIYFRLNPVKARTGEITNLCGTAY